LASYARDPRAYELMAILLPDLADEDLTGTIDRVSGYITAVTGSIKETLTDSPWGRRRLAYSIRFNSQDYRDGIYVIWHFDLEPSRMTEIERELKLDTRVIRYLVVHDDPKWGSPNEGNQPPPGEAESGDRRPARDGDRRPARAGERRPAPAGERRPPREPAAQTVSPIALTTADSPVDERADAANAAAGATDDSTSDLNGAVAVADQIPATPDNTSDVADESAGTADNTAATADETVSTTESTVATADEVATTTDQIAGEVVVPESMDSEASEAGAASEEVTVIGDSSTNPAVDKLVAEEPTVVSDKATVDAESAAEESATRNKEPSNGQSC